MKPCPFRKLLPADNHKVGVRTVIAGAQAFSNVVCFCGASGPSASTEEEAKQLWDAGLASRPQKPKKAPDWTPYINEWSYPLGPPDKKGTRHAWDTPKNLKVVYTAGGHWKAYVGDGRLISIMEDNLQGRSLFVEAVEKALKGKK